MHGVRSATPPLFGYFLNEFFLLLVKRTFLQIDHFHLSVLDLLMVFLVLGLCAVENSHVIAKACCSNNFYFAR